jgi:hypothetical protein
MTPGLRVGLFLLLALFAASFGNAGGLWGAGVDWILLILFFGLRNEEWPFVVVTGFMLGLLMSLLNIGSPLEWVLRVESAALMIFWLYPLIHWNRPRIAVIVFWVVIMLYNLGSLALLELLGRPETWTAVLVDLRRDVNTGLAGTLLVFGIYGIRLIRYQRPGELR